MTAKQTFWFLARAPGRLDVLGGVADYSGGLVLEKTVAEGVLVRVATAASPRCVARTALQTADIDPEVTVDCRLVFEGSPSDLGQFLAEDPRRRWAAYVLGPIAVLAARFRLPPRGVWIDVQSSLPHGAGLASSAALEVASLVAARAALGVEVPREEVPLLAQRAEHEVAFAPCGLMDQVTVFHGEEGRLLPLLCQPMIVNAAVPVPPGLHLAGIASGVTHHVGGSAYRRVRAAAFMGKTLLGLAPNDHLAALLPAEYGRRASPGLPVRMTGAEFLAANQGHGDPATRVDPDETYPVRAATEHPIFETERARRFLEILSALHLGDDKDLLAEAGAILDTSQASYRAMGLNCPETDLLHSLLKNAGPKHGVYGSRTSGGGCGGTVAILADERGIAALPRLAGEYVSRTEVQARSVHLLVGSSPGAVHVPVQRSG